MYIKIWRDARLYREASAETKGPAGALLNEASIDAELMPARPVATANKGKGVAFRNTAAIVVASALVVLGGFSKPAKAEPITAVICQAGACAPLPPPVALTVITASLLKKIIAGNFDAAQRESGDFDKVLRAITGVSARDWRDHGIWGGSNSLFRCPSGSC